MKKLGYLFMITGILLFIVSQADIISIVISFMERLFMIELHAAFFATFIFRCSLLGIGGIFLLIGGVMLKKEYEINKFY